MMFQSLLDFRIFSVLSLGLFFANLSLGQNQPVGKESELISAFLDKLSAKNKENLKKVQGYFEIHFIQIDRDGKGVPNFTKHVYEGRKNAYYNPASLVKIPTVLMTLEKLEALGIDKFSRYETKSQSKCRYKRDPAEKSLEGYDNLANEIRKVLLVSDNLAYNVLFDFLGQEDIAQRLRDKKYNDTRIIRRFADCSLQDNSVSNPFWFYNKSNQLIYEQKALVNSKPISLPEQDILVGKGYKQGNKLIRQPKSLKSGNYLVLNDVLSMLQALIFPESVETSRRWKISQENRNFVLKFLAMLPRESNYVDFKNPKNFDDTYKKLFIFGDQKQIQSDVYQNIKSLNMIGFSFGFMSDVAYIVDFENNLEFFIAAAIYANTDDIIDGSYNYVDIARPFFAELGRIVLEHERKRFKKFPTDLAPLKTAISL